MYGLSEIVRMNRCLPALENTPKKYGSNLEVVVKGNNKMWLSYGYYPVVIKDDEGKVYVNRDKVSPTTTRQTTKVIRDIGGYNSIELSKDEMADLSKKIGF